MTTTNFPFLFKEPDYKPFDYNSDTTVSQDLKKKTPAVICNNKSWLSKINMIQSFHESYLIHGAATVNCVIH